MIENNLLSIIIFAPLLGAVINWLIGGRLKNETFSGAVACGSIAISTFVAFYIAFIADGGALFINQPILDHIWTWVQVGTFRADFALGMDRLSGIYALFVTFVGLLIHIFATGYMKGDPGFYRFFAYMNLFMFSMLTLVLADNFLLMFVGWEGVGLCSYLLIGFYIKWDEARRAAKKAFVMNRIGDWGVLMGVFLIFTLTGTISFYDKAVDGTQVQSVFSWISQNVSSAEPFTLAALTAGGLTSVALLLFIGATGKSAQIPLLTWLPDAMAGPTPVSALIHAATMVTAGVYMVVRCNSIYQHAPTAMFVVAIIGAATAIFAASIGLAQNDIKKVLAYSTVSQLGYMFLACGVGAFITAIFHVMTHAFFKALLFLGSGSVIHGMHHEQDMRRMGNLRKYMPITFITMMACWLAICGIPIRSGFFSKDEINNNTFSEANLPEPWNYVLWIVGLITAVMTAVYMTRMMWMTFFGEERFQDEIPKDGTVSLPPVPEGEDHHGDSHDFHPHESPWVMTAPLIVLAALSTLGGLVGVPYALSGGAIPNAFEHTLEPVIAQVGKAVHDGHSPAVSEEVKHFYTSSEIAAKAETSEEHSAEELRTERLLAGLSVLLALAGIGIGIVIFGKTPLKKMPTILVQKWRLDEFYNGYIVDPITRLSTEGLWKGFDLGFIDGIVNGIGHFVAQFGNFTRHLQVGFVRSYAAVIILGALAVLGYFLYYGLKLVG
jgi:NADH-quinone oxidoreductase subunit L